MDKINIPPEAVEALRPFTCCGCDRCLAKAIRAALAAWPGAAICHYTIADNEGYEMVLPLPFPQENPDA